MTEVISTSPYVWVQECLLLIVKSILISVKSSFYVKEQASVLWYQNPIFFNIIVANPWILAVYVATECSIIFIFHTLIICVLIYFFTRIFINSNWVWIGEKWQNGVFLHTVFSYTLLFRPVYGIWIAKNGSKVSRISPLTALNKTTYKIWRVAVHKNLTLN